MDIKVDMDTVLKITQERLVIANQENIMLQAVVQDQQNEMQKLRETLDKIGEGTDGE